MKLVCCVALGFEAFGIDDPGFWGVQGFKVLRFGVLLLRVLGLKVFGLR